MNQNDIPTHQTPSTHSNQIMGFAFFYYYYYFFPVSVLQKVEVALGIKTYIKTKEDKSKCLGH